MRTRADKGNSIFILSTQQHESKIQDFLHGNDFITTTKDPTNTYQTDNNNTIKQSKTLIPNASKWKYINLKTSAPSIKGLIKLHKLGMPTRPVVNWRNAPTYRFSRLFTQKINNIAPLPNTFNLKNTTDLLQKLQETPMAPPPTFHTFFTRYHQPILKHPGIRNKRNSQKHTGIPSARPTNTKRTYNVTRCHHQAELLHPQPRHNIPT